MGRTEENKNAKWQKHFEEQKRSGKSQAQYCRERGLDIKRFGYWQRKFKGKETLEGRFIDLTGAGSSEDFEISLKGGAITIQVPASYGLTRIVEELDV